MESLFYFLPSISTGIDSDATQFTSQIFRIVGFLGILSVLAFLFTRFYKGKNLIPVSSTSSGKIQIADTHSLGNRQFLVVAHHRLWCACAQLSNAGQALSAPLGFVKDTPVSSGVL